MAKPCPRPPLQLGADAQFEISTAPCKLPGVSSSFPWHCHGLRHPSSV